MIVIVVMGRIDCSRPQICKEYSNFFFITCVPIRIHDLLHGQTKVVIVIDFSCLSRHGPINNCAG